MSSYPWPHRSTTAIDADVLVVGGGVAGCNAALAAARQGVSVALVEKGGAIERSGNAGAGVVNFATFLEQEPTGDDSESLFQHLLKASNGIVPKQVLAAYAEKVHERFRDLESIGVNFTNPITRDYFRLRTFGAKTSYSLQFDGRDFKRVIARQLGGLGVRVVERVMVTGLVADGRVSGAFGFHVRTGRFHLFNARAVVLTTGDTLRLYPSPSGFPFNTWHSPYNTGDGKAMAFRSGARLANLEFPDINMIPKGFGSAGTATFTGMGAHLINARAERFMTEYHPQAERAPRPYLVAGIMTENREGRGPCYIDCRHLSRESLALLIQGCLTDKPTLAEYFAQKGIDLSQEPMEVEISEFHLGGKGGLLIDETCQTNLPGLFAAGECAVSGSSISVASVLGYLAGEQAAKQAKGQSLCRPDPVALDSFKDQVFTPLSQDSGMMPAQLEDLVRQIMIDQLGYLRSQGGMSAALTKLTLLEKEAGQLRATDGHQLMRAHEAANLLTLAKLVARSALERKESRGWDHVRSDYPHQDDQNWLKFVVVEPSESGGTKVSFLPVN